MTRADEADTALARIRQNKAVTISFRESAAPFAYLDESRQPSGYSIDICKRIVTEIGHARPVPAGRAWSATSGLDGRRAMQRSDPISTDCDRR